MPTGEGTSRPEAEASEGGTGDLGRRGFDADHECKVAWWLTGIVLVTLTVVKPLGGIAVVGTIGFTIAAALQLYLPLWRCEKIGVGYELVGLHFNTWRKDLA